MTVKGTKKDQVYNQAIGRTTLRGIWMTSCQFDVKPEAVGRSDLALKRAMKVQVDEAVILEDGRMYGFISYEASSRLQRQKLIKVQAKYFVSYHCQGGCDQATADMFMDRVGRLAAYPYFRSLAATLTSQAGVHSPPLPMLSFQPRMVDYAVDPPAAENQAKD